MRKVIVLITCVLALPAMADTVCTFTTECLEGEACNATQMALTLAPVAGSDGQWQMQSDAETIDGVGYQRGGPAHLVFFGESAGHFVTIDGDFNARYSVHMEGPFSITYHGTCEGS